MSSLLGAALASAVALTACQKVDDAAFGARVREYLLAHPEVLREAIQKLNEKESQASQAAVAGAIEKHRAALERDPRDLVANPNGKYTVVEFYDYRCGYCKMAAPEIVKIIKDNPDVRFVFKELPIFGEVSDNAAKIALTPQVRARGLDLYSRMMAEKNLTDPAIDRHLADLGLQPAVVREAAKSGDIAKHIADTHTLARDLKIEGTPAFIIGDVLVPGADMNALRAAIAAAKGGPKT